MASVLALDIGGTRIKAARVSASGEIQDSRQAHTPSSLDSFFAVARSLVAELSAGEPVAAAGFGCKGIVNPATTVVEVLPGTLSYLEGSRLADLVPGLPAAADNDARAAMAGELAWGSARGCSDAVMLTLGTGVGGAIVVNGRLLKGATGVAGHLGHLTVDPAGEWCICGNRGCLETVFSARAIESVARAAAHRGVACGLHTAITCDEVFQLARAGDPIAASIVDRAVRVLGAALAGIVHTFDPEIVIIGGQIAEAGDFLLAPLRQELDWRTRVLIRRQVPLVCSSLPDPSGVLGAAALALHLLGERR